MGNNVPTGSKILKHGPPSAVSNSETDMGPTMINKSKPTEIHQSALSPRNPDVVKPALTFKTVREPKSEVFEGLDYLSDDSPEAFYKGKIPVVFKWSGAGNSIFVSGSYDNWTSKTPLVKSMENFYSIIELPEGFHQYKFEVDGTWCCDTNEPKIANTMGSENNYIAVKRSDFEVFEALTSDAASMLSTTHSYQDERKQRDPSGRPPSPPGEYTKQMPDLSGTNMYNVYRAPVPPTLPPMLQHGVLNKDVSMSNEPDLLPMPNTCTLNHVYALSIKDGLMVLSQGRRYRKKFVTTLFYRPI